MFEKDGKMSGQGRTKSSPENMFDGKVAAKCTFECLFSKVHYLTKPNYSLILYRRH